MLEDGSYADPYADNSDSGSSSSSDTGSPAVSILGDTASGAAAGSMLGPYGAAAGAVIGAGLGVFGAIESGNAQAEIDRKKQALANAQADEILARERINDANRSAAGFKTMADVSSANAGTGHEGAGIGSQLEVKRQVDLTNAIQDQESRFSADMLRAGGHLQGMAGNQAQTAGYLGAASSIIGGAGKIASPSAGIFNYKTQSQSLPSPGESF